jgi:hypothetical protein
VNNNSKSETLMNVETMRQTQFNAGSVYLSEMSTVLGCHRPVRGIMASWLLWWGVSVQCQ